MVNKLQHRQKAKLKLERMLTLMQTLTPTGSTQKTSLQRKDITEIVYQLPYYKLGCFSVRSDVLIVMFFFVLILYVPVKKKSVILGQVSLVEPVFLHGNSLPEAV